MDTLGRTGRDGGIGFEGRPVTALDTGFGVA